MRPDVYCNVELRGRQGLPAALFVGKALSILHPHFSKHPDTFAVAFPELWKGDVPSPGKTLRLFSTDRDALEAALDLLEQDPHLRDLLNLQRVRKVPEAWEGPWVVHERFRVPSRKGKDETHQAKRLRLRASRLAEAQRLPYLKLRSRSNGQEFSLFFQTQEVSAFPKFLGTPDGYGLSRPSAPVPLPKLE
ncbi:MAG: type I-F CRISPR-associated endoribonuclease Cas6/Csy4 [SAR324 cluster bacterium]|nr:type I-F CRISPR-associated endoribonuclease Cas6/Csy4 [SAR324 cluster bacterium]